MDGTLVDSEKLWDVAINELYSRRGRVLAPEVRDATVGGSADGVIRIVFDDLGLDPNPEHMAEVADWMHDYVGELFDDRVAVVSGRSGTARGAAGRRRPDGTGDQHPPGSDRERTE